MVTLSIEWPLTLHTLVTLIVACHVLLILVVVVVVVVVVAENVKTTNTCPVSTNKHGAPEKKLAIIKTACSFFSGTPVYNSTYNSSCSFVFYYGLLLLPFALMYFSAFMDSVILNLPTVLLLFCCTALLFSSYSTIFIAASVSLSPSTLLATMMKNI